MADRFDSYLRHAAELLRSGDVARAEGLERLARETLERLGSPPKLAARLHALRGDRAMRQADYPQAEQAYADAVAALLEAGAEPRELFEMLQRLGIARSHQGHGRSRDRGLRRGARGCGVDRPGVPACRLRAHRARGVAAAPVAPRGR